MQHVFIRKLPEGSLTWTLIDQGTRGDGRRLDVVEEIQDAWLEGEPINPDEAKALLQGHGFRLDISG